MENLGQIAVEIGVDLNPLEHGLQTALTRGESGGNKVGASFGSGFAVGFQSRSLNAIGAINDLLSGAQTIARTAGAVTGVGIAAQYERLQVGFKGLLGSGRAAQQLMDDLAKKGAETPFDTSGLTSTARGLIAVGVEAKNVTRDVGAIADAVAAAGGENPELAEMGRMLQMLRVRPHPELESLGAIAARGVDLDKVVGAATGRQYKTGEGMRALQNMTGAQAYDTIISGFQKTYGGAAAGQAGGTLSGLAANAQESVGLALKPTGDLLLPVLKETTGLLVQTGNAFGDINKATGGSVGLVASIGLGVLTLRYFGGVAKDAVVSTTAAAAAVQTLAGAAQQLTVAAGAATTATEAETIAKGAGTSASVGRAAIEPASGAMGAGVIAGRMGAMLLTALPFIIPVVVGGIMTYYGGQMKSGPEATVQDRGNGAALSGAGTGAAVLGTVGAIAGFFLGGPPGAAIGATVGSLVGAGFGASAGVTQESMRIEQEKSEQKKNTDALHRNTDALQKLAFSAFGGGDRLRGGLRSLEMEYSVMRSLRLKVG